MLSSFSELLVFNKRQLKFLSVTYKNYSIFYDEPPKLPKNTKALEEHKKNVEKSKNKFNFAQSTENTWYSKFKVFGNEEQNSDFLTLMQQPINLRPSAIKLWWQNRKEYIDQQMQQFIPQRHEILGNDLAAAHFIVFRGGSVKFLHQSEWVRANEYGEFNLPSKYDENWKLEAICCDDMKLYYEGLENLINLEHLKNLSFVNVRTFDDWCLDRLSGSNFPVLNKLDLRGTNITYRGLSALYRMDSLKLLIVDDVKISKEFELSCVLLEEIIPKLKIYSKKDLNT